MNARTLLASRYDVAVDGLRSTLALYRNSDNQFELMNTCLEHPEEDFREVVTSDEASEFIMDRDTVLTAPANTAIAQPQMESVPVRLPVERVRVLTPVQIAKRWGVAAESVRFMIHTGRLNGFRIGKRALRVRLDVVEAFEARGTEGEVYAPEKRKLTISEQIGWSIRIANMRGPKRPK